MRFQLLAVVCLVALAGCGGGGGESAPPAAGPAPPTVVPPPPVIGAAGGTITDTSGATVVIPAGALSADTTFRVAMDSTGAPPLPAGLTGAGNMYVITPHGGDFPVGVEVSLPAPNVTLAPNQELRLAKAQPNGQWEILDATLAGGKLTTTVNSFSFFTGVVITYVLPLAQAVPLDYTTTLTCGDQDCTRVLGPVTATFTIVGNGGQIPENCPGGHVDLIESDGTSAGPPRVSVPTSGPLTVTREIPPGHHRFYVFHAVLICPDYTISRAWDTSITWAGQVAYPNVSILRMPAQLDVVEGTQADLIAILGGAIRFTGPGGGVTVVPSVNDSAVITWERSDDAAASWREIARSFQYEANPLPYGTGRPWIPWSARHSFVATATDQGARIRARACYTPPPPTAAVPCVTGPATLINVLQQSALPAIATQPRSVLIRTGETANFSVVASGQPAPTLQWQTRPANSSGAWTDVAAGTGATTAHYTTAPRAPSDNGEQYRVVATNAVGSAASVPVTVSVSDVDVAPSITAQPADLNVESGGDAIFAIDAHGTEALGYQWRFNGADIPGANSPILRLSGVTGAHAGSYSVVVSNAAGAVSSNAATLNVVPGAPAAVAPSIVTQPSPVSVNAGNTATLAVGVAGTGPFAFQWRRNGVDMAGATSAVLTFSSVALPNAGDYSVRVTNSAGEVVSDTVLLDVTAASGAQAPAITTQPATVIVPLDGSAVIAVGATGSGPLEYQWYLEGVALPGSTSPVLSFSHLGQADFGRYTVTVTNIAGTVTSQPADLILLGAPTITQQPGAASVIEGNNATFSVGATGSGLRYQWSVNGTPIPGAIAATYNTPSLVGANSGSVYSVMVYNAAGHVFSQGAVLTVTTLVAPTITQHPANVTIQPGQPAEMCLAVGGTPTFDVNLQRWDGAAWVPGTDVLLNGNTQACYFTAPLTLAETGAQFRFRVTNAAGQVFTNAATVTVQTPALGATTLVSVAMNGQVPGFMSRIPSVSADGRYVAFISDGVDLVPGTTVNGHAYVRDLALGVTTLIDHTPAGTEANRAVQQLKISSNGRYAVFSSQADDILPNTGTGTLDVFRADLLTGTIVQVNVLPDGDPAPSFSANADLLLDISGDGNVVMFRSSHDVLSPTGDENPGYYLYARDIQWGQSRLVFGSPTHQVGWAALSDNGEYLAYVVPTFSPDAQAITLLDLEANSEREIFSFDQSVAPTGIWSGMTISANGRWVAFSMISPALFGGSTASQVVLLDRDDPNFLEVISTGASGLGNANSLRPRISGDGRYVLFTTQASNLSPAAGIANSVALVRRDRVAQTATTASLSLAGTPIPIAHSDEYAISRDGAVIAFAAEEARMTGVGGGGFQIYAAPRP